MKANGQKTGHKNGKSAKSKLNNATVLGVENFDWERMRQRLAGLTSDVLSEEDGEALALDQVEVVWAQRAEQMAQLPQEEDTGDQVEVVIMRVGRELLGIPVEHINAIRPMEPVTRVPRVPAWVVGVVNLRGSILSVIDLRTFLNLPVALNTEGEEEKANLLVHTITKDLEIVLLVNDVPGVEAMPVKSIQHEPNILRGIRPEYVRGIVHRHTGKNGDSKDDPVIVLNIETLLSDRRIIIYDEPA